MRCEILFLSFCAMTTAQFGFGGFGGDSPVGSVGSLAGKVSNLRNFTKIATATGCFTNQHGYKCCSRVLDTFLTVTFKVPLVETVLETLDLQKTVNTLLGMVQDQFGTSFEIILSPHDFSSKNSFRGDLMCKTKTPQGKVLLVYSTPVPYSTAAGENRPLSDKEIKEKGWSSSLLSVSALNFGS